MKLKNAHIWVRSLLRPSETFEEEAEKEHSLTDGLLHIFTASLILVLIIILSGTVAPSPIVHAVSLIVEFDSMVPIAGLVILTNIVVWLVISRLVQTFSHMLKGSGSFWNQAYALAIFSAPVSVVLGILSVERHFNCPPAPLLMCQLYGFYRDLVPVLETFLYVYIVVLFVISVQKTQKFNIFGTG